MLKVALLGLALMLLAAAQEPADNETNLEISQLNDTELGSPSYRFMPFTLRDKLYAANVFTRANWFGAQQICSYQGMNLASINTPADAELLRRYLVENGLTSNNIGFWISGTNLADNRQWTWMSNGYPVLYNNWRAGEPNNGGNNEHCLEVNLAGEWNDLSCDKHLFFICENRCQLDSYSVPLIPQLSGLPASFALAVAFYAVIILACSPLFFEVPEFNVRE